MSVFQQKHVLRPDFPFIFAGVDNLEYPPHWHEEIEMIYVKMGMARVGLNHEIITLGHGDILLCSGGDVHQFLAPPLSEQNHLILIQLGLSLFEPMASIISSRRFVKYLFHPHTESQPDAMIYRVLQDQILMIYEEYTEMREDCHVIIKAEIFRLASLILRHVPMEKYDPAEKSKQVKKNERLNLVFQFVEKNYRREIRLGEVSKVINFSVYHFTRFFRETTGMTFGHYLNDFRIKKAETYLRDPERPISEIAFLVGFNSVQNFCRVFKERKGHSPSEYRKMMFY